MPVNHDRKTLSTRCVVGGSRLYVPVTRRESGIARDPVAGDSPSALDPMDYAAQRLNMVESQLRPNRVTDGRILAAMGSLPRELFLPKSLRGIAYVDEDIKLNHRRVLMEPMVLARLLQLASISGNDVVLLIGLGSGYEAAVAARLASTVVAVDSDAAIMSSANRLFAELSIDNVVAVEGPLAEGYPKQAPYDVIVFVGAVGRIPPTMEAQLAEGGRMVAVVAPPAAAPRATLVVRQGGILGRRVAFDATTPVLPEFELETGFVF